MKRIKPEELPAVLTPDVITTLAMMIDEVPQSREWHQIFHMLSAEDYERVEEGRSELQREEHNRKRATMTEAEKQKQKEWWDNWNKNPDPDVFFGNMGQPETLEQFKNRYGRYPWGYDENGNKTDEA